MLDAYIIERIREKREEQRDGGFIPLNIEVPRPSPRPEGHRQPNTEDDPNRGTAIVDYRFG